MYSRTQINISGLCILCAALFLSGCVTKPVSPLINPQGAQIEAYIRTWPLPSFMPDNPPEHWRSATIQGQYLTELVIIPAVLEKTAGIYTGAVVFPSVKDQGAPFYEIWGEISSLKEKYPHLKVLPSYGGWGVDGFSQICAQPEKRKRFISAITEIAETHNLDGADIDWEYPVGPEWKIAILTSPKDRENYVTLLRQTRVAFDKLGDKTGKTYKLSVTVPAGRWFTEKNDVAEVAAIVDELKIKSFELYGGWNKTTGHHANLYKNPADPEQESWSLDQAVQAYLTAGVPAAKLIAGVAFYGKAWKGVPDNGVHGLFQKYESVAYPEGLLWSDLKPLLKPRPKFKRYWDDTAKAAWLYDGKTFISYVDPQELTEIASYVKQKGLGGVIIYEYADDMSGELLKILAEALQ